MRFQYFGDGDNNIFNDKIERVDLYIFDSYYELIEHREYDKTTLNTPYSAVELNLKPGVYNIVCIGNIYNHTLVQNVESGSFEEIKIAHPNVFMGGNITTNDSLYYAYKSIAVDQNQSYENIIFNSSHVTFAVIIESNEAVVLQIENLQPYMDFNGKLTTPTNQLISYYPKLIYDDNQRWTSYFNTLRPNKYSDVNINLIRVDEVVIFSLSLIDFLIDNPHIDVTNQEVIIPIMIKYDGLDILVTAPDWIIDEITSNF